MHRLISRFEFELVEDHHSFGSLKFGIVVKFAEDIGPVLPYLNAVLQDTRYDGVNRVLIGADGQRRYAFRSHQIHIGRVSDAPQAESIAGEAVDLVNRTWNEREHIMPSSRERKLPGVYEIFALLPKNNCKRCGYPTCLAFAADVRNRGALLEKCPRLSEDSRRRIASMFEEHKERRGPPL
jgi:ArsR family metal-binding transcriptional regulator